MSASERPNGLPIGITNDTGGPQAIPAGLTTNLEGIRVGPATPITANLLHRIRPTRATVVDSDRLVWESEAFPSFARSDDFYMAQQIISTPERTAWPRQPGKPDALLPEVRCGDSNGKGGRCGRRLTPVRAKDQLLYSSPRCAQRAPRHRAGVSSLIEDVVVQIVKEAYAEEALESAIRSVRTRTLALQTRVESLRQEFSSIAERCNAASDKILMAEHAGDVAEADHWKEQAIRYRSQREVTRHALDETQHMLLDAQTPKRLTNRLEIVRSVATRLPELLNHAKMNRPRLREMLAILVRDVCVRHVAPYLTVVEVTFPNGGATQRLVVTRLLVNSQPERAIARARLSSGVAPDIIAQELTAGQGRGRESTLVSTKHVFTLALLSRYFEQVQPRKGGVPVEEIAQRVGEDLDTIRRVVLRGALGPAHVSDDGSIAIAPTEEELEIEFPPYALARTEERSGWQRGDAVPPYLLKRHFQFREGQIDHRKKADPSASTTDLAGRSYFRLSAFGISPDSPRPALKRFVGKCEYDPVQITAAVVAAGYDASEGDNFYPKASLIEALRRAGSRTGFSALRKADIKGTVPHISCNIRPTAGRAKALKVLVWCPKIVRDEPTDENIRTWLRGNWSAQRAVTA